MDNEQLINYNFPFKIEQIEKYPQLYKNYLYIDLSKNIITIKEIEEKKFNNIFINTDNFVPNIFEYNNKKYFKVIEANYYSNQYFCEILTDYNTIKNEFSDIFDIEPIYVKQKIRKKLASIKKLIIKIKNEKDKNIIIDNLKYNIPISTLYFEKYKSFNILKDWKEKIIEDGFGNYSTYPDMDYFVYKNNKYFDLYFNYNKKYEILNENNGHKHNFSDKKIMYNISYPSEYFKIINYEEQINTKNSLIVGLKTFIFLNQITIFNISINEAMVNKDLIDHIKLNNVYIVTHIPITLYYKTIFFNLLGKYNMNYSVWKYIIDNNIKIGLFGLPVIIHI